MPNEADLPKQKEEFHRAIKSMTPAASLREILRVLEGAVWFEDSDYVRSINQEQLKATRPLQWVRNRLAEYVSYEETKR